MKAILNKISAFLKGGCLFLLLFLVVGFIVALAGGSAHADLIGLFLLFLTGGLIGVAVQLGYEKGYRDATRPGAMSPGPAAIGDRPRPRVSGWTAVIFVFVLPTIVLAGFYLLMWK